ncbi:MAG: alpha/beta hydrolase [Flavobacteriaceae bacterium]|nr:MAG: alpha/beta hydrolase [Flavobacteriaceae bacterium]
MLKALKLFIFFIVAINTLSCSSLKRSVNQSKNLDPTPFTVETIGKGKPILYLPGFTVSGSIWKETIENLSLKRKSYLFSYAGFNGNKPIEMPWYDTIKKSIIQYIKTNNLNKIVIIGHSMGGNLAVDIASELPNRVSKIVIVEALPCMREVMMPNVSAESLFYNSPYNKQMLEMDEEQFKNMASMMASNMTINSAKIDVLTNWILEADRKTWVYGFTDLLKLDLRNVLSNIKCQTLIVGASFPNLKIAKENYENQYSNLSNKTIRMVPNSKHFVMFDQPTWFYKSVNDFLFNGKK